MKLTKAKEKITSQKIKGEKLSAIIKTACMRNDQEEIMSWLVRNNFFGDVFYVIWGVNQSNKWTLLKKEIPDYCIKQKFIIELAFSRHLASSEIDLYDLKKTTLTFNETLSIYGFLERCQGMFPATTAGFLNAVNAWNKYLGNKVSYLFSENIFQLINENNDSIMDSLGIEFKLSDLQRETREALEPLFHALFFYAKELTMEQSDFQKSLFATTFFRHLEIILDNRSNKKLKSWAELETHMIDIILKDADTTLALYSRNKAQKYYMESKPFYKYCKGTALEKLIGFKVFQLTLFKNLTYDKDEVRKINFINEYVDGLFDIGVLSDESDSFSFNWPSISDINYTETALEEDSQNIFDKFDAETPLKTIGYTVGNNGGSPEYRRNLLDDFYKGESWGEKYTGTSWGSPKSSERLERMAYHLYYQIINKKKLGHEKAVSDWQEDLEYLKQKYYKGESKMKFSFPETD